MKNRLLFSETDVNIESWFDEALKKLSIQEKPGWPDQFGDALYNWVSKNIKKKIRTLSLFTGAGGLDIGFHDAGFQIVECVEIEKDFVATLQENANRGGRLEESNIICMDINDYNPNLKHIDFIIGGPPCQSFSAAGARVAGVNGIDDDRGSLFQHYVRILKKLKPKGFLFENVYRIVGAQGGKPWKLIQMAFQEAGYKLYWRILDAADYGVPQFRERLFIVGLREGQYRFPFPSHGPDSLDKRNYYTAGQAIEGVSSQEKGKPINGRHGHLLKDIPPGLNYSFYTEKMGHPIPYFSWRSKFSDYLYKADPETPVRTIKAQGGQYTGPFHWKNRTFTIEELKRLQTFPDNYIIVGSRRKVIQQLGNSVPPQLARILAISIAQQVFNIEFPFKLKLMPETFKLGFRARKNKLTKIYKEKAAKAIYNLKYKNIIINNEHKSGFFFLREDFELVKSQKKEQSFWVEHKINNNILHVAIKEHEGAEQTLYFKILILPNDVAYDSFKQIELFSYIENSKSITMLWKYLEKLLKEKIQKDDLVQYFGYFQYPRRHIINFKFQNNLLKENITWKIISYITNGILIGRIVSLYEMSISYKIDQSILIDKLHELKKLGYEIRNKNTNRQIKKDCILIPYQFPTLNPRSLQRFKEL